VQRAACSVQRAAWRVWVCGCVWRRGLSGALAPALSRPPAAPAQTLHPDARAAAPACAGATVIAQRDLAPPKQPSAIVAASRQPPRGSRLRVVVGLISWRMALRPAARPFTLASWSVTRNPCGFGYSYTLGRKLLCAGHWGLDCRSLAWWRSPVTGKPHRTTVWAGRGKVSRVVPKTSSEVRRRLIAEWEVTGQRTTPRREALSAAAVRGRPAVRCKPAVRRHNPAVRHKAAVREAVEKGATTTRAQVLRPG
jgi:hypothetical protein